MDAYIKAKQHAERYIKKGDRVLVCFSGGPDSSALLHIMHRLSKTRGFDVFAAHFNHKLRGRESAADAAFCGKICKEYGVRLFEGRADTKEAIKKSSYGPEKTARSLRYAFFLKTALKNRIDKIALAHTLDDNAETIFFRFIKGAGSEGLSGISECRAVKEGDFGVKLGRAVMFFIRPLLGENKQGVLNYIQKNRLKYRNDRSNQEFDYDRNKIRHRLIPAVENEINPSFRETITSLAPVFEADNDFLDKSAASEVIKCAKITGKKAEIKRKHYAGLHPAIRYRVTRLTLERLFGGRRKITKNLVFGVDAAIIDKKRADLPLGLKIEPRDGEKSVIRHFFIENL